MTFDMLPHKVKRDPSKMASTMWPDCGNSFELNLFYEKYESCEGEIGEAFIFFWSAQEIEEYEPLRVEMYPATWKVFGGDGGGTYFGFCNDRNKRRFFSCDPIDPKGSVTWLGEWSEFIRRVGNAEYV